MNYCSCMQFRRCTCKYILLFQYYNLFISNLFYKYIYVVLRANDAQLDIFPTSQHHFDFYFFTRTIPLSPLCGKRIDETTSSTYSTKPEIENDSPLEDAYFVLALLKFKSYHQHCHHRPSHCPHHRFHFLQISQQHVGRGNTKYNYGIWESELLIFVCVDVHIYTTAQ